MKNLRTTTEKTGATTTISKVFNTTTSQGHEVVITAYRRVISVTSDPFKSRVYFGVSFKGVEFGHNDMDKRSLLDAISVINIYGNKI